MAKASSKPSRRKTSRIPYASESVTSLRPDFSSLSATLTEQILRAVSLEEIFQTTVQAAQQLLQVDRVFVYRFLGNGEGCIVAEAKAPEGIDPSLATQSSLVVPLHATLPVPCIPASSISSNSLPEPGCYLPNPSAVPTCWGLWIANQYREPRHWEPWEEQGWRSLASQLAIAIQQAELREQVVQCHVVLRHLNANLEAELHQRTFHQQRQLQFASVLRRMTEQMRDSLDERQILQMAVQGLAEALQVKGCNASIYNLKDGTSTIRFEYAPSLPSCQGRVIHMANSPELYQQLFQGEEFQFCSLVPHPLRGLVAMLVCPIHDDQGVLGDIWLINHAQRGFDDAELQLVYQVANQCAIALRQARLYEAAKSHVQELEHLNQLKDGFISTISHELRTPMTNMKLAVEMLEMTLRQLTASVDAFSEQPTLASLWERILRYLSIFRTEYDRELDLINDLLDLQRLESAETILALESVDLRVELPLWLKPFHTRAEQHKQHLKVTVPDRLPVLVTEKSSVMRIFKELLTNACKYTPEGEQILVSVASQEEAIQIRVSNTGVEIPRPELPRIFEKFYRMPTDDPWRQSGTGLGLALVQHLVMILGGAIQVESAAKVTSFTIRLPLVSIGMNEKKANSWQTQEGKPIASLDYE